MDTPSSPARRPSLRLLGATILLLALTEFLQAGMTAFAAVPIMGQVGIGPAEFSLVAAVYASVAIVVISMQRWAVERIGGRRFVQGCATVTVAGALLCATSDGFASFLAGRAVMALGGGSFFTASRMIIQHTLAGPRRFVGIRCLASGLALGIAAAPWLAALAVDAGHWRAIYGGIAVLAAAILVLAGLALPGAPPVASARTELHAGLQALLAVSSFLLVHALQRFQDDAAGAALPATLMLVAALAGGLFYLFRQHRAARPLLQLRALLHPRYLWGLALFFIAYVMLGANNFALPTLLVGTLGFAWETVGRIEAIGLSVAMLTWLVLSTLLPRMPAPRKYLVTGFAALAGFGLLLARIETGADLVSHVLPALALNSVFLLTVLPVAAMQTFRALEHDETVFSHAQQLKNMMGQAGTGFGITLATLGLQWRTAVHYDVLAAQAQLANPAFDATLRTLQQAFAAAMPPDDAARAALAQLARLFAQQSAMLAHVDHFSAVALVGVLGIAATLVQRVFR